MAFLGLFLALVLGPVAERWPPVLMAERWPLVLMAGRRPLVLTECPYRLVWGCRPAMHSSLV